MSTPLNLTPQYLRMPATDAIGRPMLTDAYKADAMRRRQLVHDHHAPALQLPPRRRPVALARMTLEAVALGCGLSSLVWLGVLAVALFR